jgi:Heterokaryon incompatibility protein (HET)
LNYNIDKMPTFDDTVARESPSSTNNEISTTMARLLHTGGILCATCERAVAEMYPSIPMPRHWFYNSTRHHQTVTAFQEAKRQGCLICSRLWARLCSESEINLSGGIIISHWLEIASPTGVELFKWIFNIEGQHQLGTRIEFDLLKDESGLYDGAPREVSAFALQDHQQTLLNIDHQLGPTTSSNSTLRLVRHWLSNCEANYPGCSPNTGMQYPLPLRVIDVGTVGETSVRLRVSGSSHEYGRYITLSHCWGNSNIFKLTSGNEQSLRAGFLIRELPKTFRQAIELTRTLSIRYLWIVSLCILQDSVDDWRQQSAVMGEIYQHCFCNIAATASPNSDGGIFVERDVERDVELLKPLNLGIKWILWLIDLPTRREITCGTLDCGRLV